MTAQSVYILTGPVQSGKTTSLIHWAEKRKDVHGIITPVMSGKRMFMDAGSKEQFAMEAGVDETEILSVGRFTFSKNGFEKAAAIIRNAVEKDGWLVIDEIGPLELRGEGFCDVLKEIWNQRNDKLLLVVREGLARRVKDHFKINATEINNINSI